MPSQSHAKYQTRIKHLEQYDPNFVRLRGYFIVACTIRGLISGLQYGVLVPSSWAYLKMFSAPAWFYGLLLSSAKILAALTSFIIGRFYDKTKRLKCITVSLNIIDIIGSVLYALPFSIWLLLVGRLMTGIGEGFITARNSEIAWVTHENERSTVYARVLLSFVTGVFLGPSLAGLLQYVELDIGYWHLDYRNFPGIISALLWLIALPITWFLVNDLARNYIDVPDGKCDYEEMCEDMLESKKTTSTVQNDLHGSSHDEISQRSMTEDDDECGDRLISSDKEMEHVPSLKEIARDILSPELLVLFVINTFAYIYLFAGDTIIPLFTQERFGWKVFYTSLIYLATAAENVVLYSVVGVIGKRISDFCLVNSGLLCMITSCPIYLIYQYTRKDLKVAEPFFCLGTVLVTAFIPLFEVGGRALLTKVIPMNSQGAVQGVYDFAVYFSGVVGPVWGVFLYTHTYLALSITLALVIGCHLWFISSRKLLQTRIEKYSKEVD